MGITREEDKVSGHACGEVCQEAHLTVGEGADAPGWEGTAERIAVQRNNAQAEVVRLRKTLERIRNMVSPEKCVTETHEQKCRTYCAINLLCMEGLK